MKDYFNLQFVMINRKIREAGFNPVFGYLLGIVAFVLLAEYVFHKTAFARHLVVLSCLGLQLRLSTKNRTDFLLSTFGDNKKTKIRVLENLIVCTPFVALLVYKNALLEGCILLVLSVILAAFSHQTNFNVSIPTPFSKKPFEFSTGFRKSFFIFPFIYTLTVIAINVDNLNLGIFSMLFVFLTSLSYYVKPEQDYFVWIHAESPGKFLRTKILIATKNAVLLASPVLISLLLFYPAEFELILLFLLIGSLFLWTIILAKYAAFPDEINLSQGIIMAFTLSFPPLILATIPFFYNKAINNLKLILHDSN